VEVMECNLTSLESVRNFVAQFRARHLPIKILICKYACGYSSPRWMRVE
jgi:NAD(P)-dependent dehydrogenase (short-subunit alcohol dehydrogenase family)